MGRFPKCLSNSAGLSQVSPCRTKIVSNEVSRLSPLQITASRAAGTRSSGSSFNSFSALSRVVIPRRVALTSLGFGERGGLKGPAGATLCVKMQTQGVEPSALPVGKVKTDANGNYAYKVPAGPDRNLIIGHRHNASQAPLSVSDAVHVGFEGTSSRSAIGVLWVVTGPKAPP